MQLPDLRYWKTVQGSPLVIPTFSSPYASNIQCLVDGRAGHDGAKRELRSLTIGSLPLAVSEEVIETVATGLKVVPPHLMNVLYRTMTVVGARLNIEEAIETKDTADMSHSFPFFHFVRSHAAFRNVGA